MLTVEGLRRTFPATKTQAEVHAVDDVSLELEPGELFTMLGPSGCGKTTTLRCVAGLEQPDAGEIRLGDRVLFSSARRIMVNANERGLGMVFQSYAIWPHMDVFSNTAFPLQVLPWKKRPSKAEIRTRVERVLDVVQLGELAGRPATDLSGGQQQRLALARALVMEPPLLLLDEPLSNLDAKLREGMRFELRRLQRELGVTSVYVTHDQIEALAMSTRIAVMRKGHIEQIGRPREIYGSPATRFVADFIGSANFIEGVVTGEGPAGETLVSTSYGPVSAISDSSHQVGEKVLMAARPESIALEEAADGDWIGVVHARAYLGDGVDHIIQMENQTFRIKTPSNVSIHDGTKVRLKFAEGACRVVPGSTSDAIPAARINGSLESTAGGVV